MRKKDIPVLLAALMAITALFVFQFTPKTVETAAWGLSFRQDNAPPIGPASSEELSRFDAAYLGDTTKKVLYLTFDAGYENGCTEKILDVLKAHNVPAAFFLVGILRQTYLLELLYSICQRYII